MTVGDGNASGTEPASLELPRPLSQYARGLAIKSARLCAGPSDPASKLDSVRLLTVSEDGSSETSIVSDGTDRTTYGCFNVSVPGSPVVSLDRLKVLYTFDLADDAHAGRVGGSRLTLSNAPAGP